MIPISLYIHLPWCIQKCPYCDFNSHAVIGSLPETAYVAALKEELADRAHLLQDRPLTSIFFGGGTPSLFSGAAIAEILTTVTNTLPTAPNLEITLEANPGTIDYERFESFRAAGVNRLSLGVQSLQDHQLKQLGRIHARDQALRAIQFAKSAGFDNFNVDLMYGLSQQTTADALSDLSAALAEHPTHLSWYQLTIEPNTLFYHQPPPLPADDTIMEMQQAGIQLLADHGFLQYEVSAYAKPNRGCAHNLNYWEFGDYLGIGAGAHSKITQRDSGEIIRFQQVKHPKDYLTREQRLQFKPQMIDEAAKAFEFMLNVLRLKQGIRPTLLTERTQLTWSYLEKPLHEAKKRGLIISDETVFKPTELGYRFLNDLVSLFL